MLDFSVQKNHTPKKQHCGINGSHFIYTQSAVIILMKPAKFLSNSLPPTNSRNLSWTLDIDISLLRRNKKIHTKLSYNFRSVHFIYADRRNSMNPRKSINLYHIGIKFTITDCSNFDKRCSGLILCLSYSITTVISKCQ